ncbi:thiolase family protein, partial [Burkholderia multivorans]|nr:hypothetical protein [Burkholderia multivorans]
MTLAHGATVRGIARARAAVCRRASVRGVSRREAASVCSLHRLPITRAGAGPNDLMQGLNMTDVVIVSAARTAVGKFGGSLAKVAAPELGATVIRAVLERAGVK